VVQGKPFIADFESSAVETDGTHRQAEGSLYRDREGRTRCECRLCSGEQFVIISNPVSGELVFLNDDDRIAQLERGGDGWEGYVWAFNNCTPHYTEEHQMMFGLSRQRIFVKDSASKQRAGEIWISRDFMIVVRDTSSNHEWRITRLESREPSPSLFPIPAGYQVVEFRFSSPVLPRPSVLSCTSRPLIDRIVSGTST
jgi:hypothetical protein